MKSSPNSRAGRNGSAKPAAQQVQIKSSGRLSQKDRKALKEVRLNVGCVSAKELEWMAADLKSQAAMYGRVAFLVAHSSAAELRHWEADAVRQRQHQDEKMVQATRGSRRSQVKAAPHWQHTEDITLCLHDPEHRALNDGLRRFSKDSNIAVVAHWLLLVALAHPVEMDRLGDGIIRYSEAEGLGQFDHMRSLIARTKAARRGKLLCTR